MGSRGKKIKQQERKKQKMKAKAERRARYEAEAAAGKARMAMGKVPKSVRTVPHVRCGNIGCAQCNPAPYNIGPRGRLARHRGTAILLRVPTWETADRIRFEERLAVPNGRGGWEQR